MELGSDTETTIKLIYNAYSYLLKSYTVPSGMTPTQHGSKELKAGDQMR